jgi:IMP cyclohydrolase
MLYPYTIQLSQVATMTKMTSQYVLMVQIQALLMKNQRKKNESPQLVPTKLKKEKHQVSHPPNLEFFKTLLYIYKQAFKHSSGTNTL